MDASLALLAVVGALLLMRAIGADSSVAATAAAVLPIVLRRGFGGTPAHLRRVTLGASSVFSTVFILSGVAVNGLAVCVASGRFFGAKPPVPSELAMAGLQALALPGLVLLAAGVLLSRHAAAES